MSVVGEKNNQQKKKAVLDDWLLESPDSKKKEVEPKSPRVGNSVSIAGDTNQKNVLKGPESRKLPVKRYAVMHTNGLAPQSKYRASAAGPSGLQKPVVMKKEEKQQYQQLGFLQNAGSSGGSTGYKGNGGGGYGGVRIRSGIPSLEDPETSKKIFRSVYLHHQENRGRKSTYIVLGNNLSPTVDSFFPVCSLTMREPGMENGINASERKFLGVHFPFPLTVDQNHPLQGQYFLYKAGTVNYAKLHLSQQALDLLRTKVAKEIYQYCASLDGVMLAEGESLPNRPEPWVLEVQEGGKELIVQVDEINLTRRTSSFVSPTVTFKTQKQNWDGSYTQDKNVFTLIAQNFFYFIEASVKTYIPQVRAALKKFIVQLNLDEGRMERYSIELPSSDEINQQLHIVEKPVLESEDFDEDAGEPFDEYETEEFHDGGVHELVEIE